MQGKIQGERDRWKASYFQNLDSEIMKLVIMIDEMGGALLEVGKQLSHPTPFHNLGSATGLMSMNIIYPVFTFSFNGKKAMRYEISEASTKETFTTGWAIAIAPNFY